MSTTAQCGKLFWQLLLEAESESLSPNKNCFPDSLLRAKD